MSCGKNLSAFHDQLKRSWTVLPQMAQSEQSPINFQFIENAWSLVLLLAQVDLTVFG